MKDEDTKRLGVIGEAIKLYFHPLVVAHQQIRKIHRQGIIYGWLFSMLFIGFAFYQLGQRVDAIEVEPIVRFAANDSELEEKILFYEDLLMGLLVCTDVQ